MSLVDIYVWSSILTEPGYVWYTFAFQTHKSPFRSGFLPCIHFVQCLIILTCFWSTIPVGIQCWNSSRLMHSLYWNILVLTNVSAVSCSVMKCTSFHGWTSASLSFDGTWRKTVRSCDVMASHWYWLTFPQCCVSFQWFFFILKYLVSAPDKRGCWG